MKNHFLSRLMLGFMFFVMTGIILDAQAQNTETAQTLKEAYTRLKPELEQNQFKSPIWLESHQDSNKASGKVYGIINQPFSAVKQNLQDPVGWCEVLFLHLNVKYCKAIDNNTIQIYGGTKKLQSISSATEMTYKFKKTADNADYMQVVMLADSGPYGTSNYKISMEAIPLNTKQSFIQVDYGYEYGNMARLAMNTYLSTIGSDKEGLSIIGKNTDGSPQYVSGMRGVIERNTLRYYLAINAYLDSLSVSKGEQLDKRLSSWFAATERHPQLHEVTKKEYISMKKDEYRRMSQNQQPMNLAQ